MFIDYSRARIFLITGSTDLRKSYNGLAGVIGSLLQEDPYSGHLFLFVNRRRNLLKLLYWQRNGFCIWQKRLNRNRFPWLNSKQPIHEITMEELQYLLRGVDIFSVHEEVFPRWA